MYSFTAPATSSGAKSGKQQPRWKKKKQKRRRGGSLRPMILVLSLVLGLFPWGGVVWIFVSGMFLFWPFAAPVAGFFMPLILPPLSGFLLLNEYGKRQARGM